jgi:hypothetical protein
MALQGHHPGVLIVRMDSDPKRDMKPHEIVRALENLIASNLAIPNHCHVLNHWR